MGVPAVQWIERVWYGETPALPPVALALDGASRIWRAGTRWRADRGAAVRAALPTIGISSPTVGGSGKTPLACWVARRLRGRGVQPALITRGHGGREAGPTTVRPGVHHAADVGDEPLWLASQLTGIPVIVGRDRAEAIRAAGALGAVVAVLDDAIMVRSVGIDHELMVLGSGGWIGNGKCLPAGPLRVAPQAVRRADALVVVVEPGTAPGWDQRASDLAGPLPVLDARVFPLAITGPDGARRDPSWGRGRPAMAWAGIARPWRFRHLLVDMGVDIRLFASFPDHHPYSRRDVDRLAREADRLDAIPLTTAKDRARWPAWARWIPHSLDVGFELSDRAAHIVDDVLGYPHDA